MTSSIIGDTRYIERSTFFDGQRLFAADLQGVEEFNRQMRWLHNQSLHQPGIGAGFAVSGAKGDREVSIQPGYAIDSSGREIVLAEAMVLAVPPVAGDDFGAPVLFDLTVSYPDEGALDVAATRQGVCGAPAAGAIRLRETPVFCWVRLGPEPDRLPAEQNAALRDALTGGMFLRLARAQVLNCRLEQPLSLAQRRNARPAAQPYVASGTADKLAWSVLGPANGATGFGVQLVATVDTSQAAFRTPPCYSAQVVGSREFSFNVKGKKVARLLDGFVTLLSANAMRFEFSLLIPDSLLSKLAAAADDPDPTTDSTFETQLVAQVAANWTIDWIGVES